MFVAHREHRLLVSAPLGFSQKIRKFLLSSQDKCLSQKYGENGRNVYSNVNKNPTGRNLRLETDTASLAGSSPLYRTDAFLHCADPEQQLGAHEIIATYSHSGTPMRRIVSARKHRGFVRTKQREPSHKDNSTYRRLDARPATICRIVVMFPPDYHASDLYQIADWQKNIFYGAHFT
jgi:hypothetical protein